MIASARMYSIDAATAAAWRALLEWVIARAGVACEVVDYPPPQPLSALWSRTDLGCAFMCGYPLARADPPPTILAAPLPGPSRYGAKPVYWTDIVVRADSSLATLDDLFAVRFAYTSEDSQSGWQAPRLLLASRAPARPGPFFSEVIGPLVTPRRVAEAIADGDADAGPLDSYAFDLLRRHAPELAAKLRVITSTPPTPIPPLVGAAAMAPSAARRMTDALLAVGNAPELEAVRCELLLQGFTTIATPDYRRLIENARAADAQGYPRIA